MLGCFRYVAVAPRTILYTEAMLFSFWRRIAIAAPVALSALSTSPSIAATLDKAKLEAYIRYAEGYTPVVKMTIGDPLESEFQGFSRVVVHLTLGPQNLDKIYFVTPDGQKVVNGTLWDMKSSPFADTISHLPPDGPAFGPSDAKVKVVVFSDFQCPYCREFAKTLREKVPAAYGKDVRVVFENFPIPSIHKWAVAGAEAGACVASADGKAFWPYHDWIFEHQGEINLENIKDKSVEYAKVHNFDAAKLAGCIESHATAASVKKEMEAGQALGVQQTPSFFINGRLVGGALKWENLQAIIQLELNRPAEVPGPIAPKS